MRRECYKYEKEMVYQTYHTVLTSKQKHCTVCDDYACVLIRERDDLFKLNHMRGSESPSFRDKIIVLENHDSMVHSLSPMQYSASKLAIRGNMMRVTSSSWVWSRWRMVTRWMAHTLQISLITARIVSNPNRPWKQACVEHENRWLGGWYGFSNI